MRPNMVMLVKCLINCEKKLIKLKVRKIQPLLCPMFSFPFLQTFITSDCCISVTYKNPCLSPPVYCSKYRHPISKNSHTHAQSPSDSTSLCYYFSGNEEQWKHLHPIHMLAFITHCHTGVQYVTYPSLLLRTRLDKTPSLPAGTCSIAGQQDRDKVGGKK